MDKPGHDHFFSKGMSLFHLSPGITLVLKDIADLGARHGLKAWEIPAKVLLELEAFSNRYLGVLKRYIPKQQTAENLKITVF